MPQNLQVTNPEISGHQMLTFNILILVEFGDFVILWQKKLSIQINN